jgi:hypothetical protein
MVIVGVGCLEPRGIVGWARVRPGERSSGTENGNGSGDGLYLSYGWTLMVSRAQVV